MTLKHLYLIYGPFILSHLINTVFMEFFGQNLASLYTAGSINAFLILLTCYLIVRNVTGIFVSWLSTLMILLCFTFQIGASNHIFPYSYDALYSTSAFLIAVLFLCYYFKTNKWIYASISVFFTSLSLLLKYDYLLLTIVIFILLFIIKPLKLKYLFISLISFLAMPLMMLLFLFFIHLKLKEIVEVVINFSQVAVLKSTLSFYTYCIGFYFNSNMVYVTISSFIVALTIVFTLNVIFYIILAVLNSPRKPIIFIKYFIIMIICTFVYMYGTFNVDYVAFNYLFSWLPISTKIILILPIVLILINILRKSNFDSWKVQSNKPQYALECFKLELSKYNTVDKLFFLLVVASVVGMSKGLYFINTLTYGPILLVLPVIVNVVFYIDYIPRMLPKLNTTLWKKTAISIVLLISITFISRSFVYYINDKTVPLQTSRGLFYADTYSGPIFKDALDFLSLNTSSSASFYMVPESHLLNFLLNRSTSAPNFYAIKQNKRYEYIKLRPPDYIVMLLDWGNPPYNENLVMKDYGSKFYNYIMENYTLEAVFKNKVRLVVYKKATNN